MSSKNIRRRGAVVEEDVGVGAQVDLDVHAPHAGPPGERDGVLPERVENGPVEQVAVDVESNLEIDHCVSHWIVRVRARPPPARAKCTIVGPTLPPVKKPI
eukprot:COSAG02_NODE_1149_length_14210_cov_40.850542_11_plen_101_part_00